MTTTPYPLELEVAITVSGGSGSKRVAHFSDTVADYAVIAPSSVAAFAIEVTETTDEGREYLRSARAPNTGNTLIRDEFEIQDGMTVYITDATDGTYYVKFWRKRQLRP